MNKILFLSLLSFILSAASKNLILVGDSRYVGMAYYLFRVKYDSTIKTTTPVSYGGFSIHVTAQVSASFTQYNTGTQLYNSVINQLSKAQSGTNVLLWLGINSLWAPDQTYNFYKTLASNYKSLKFYAISITGVNESKWGTVKNVDVKTFNNRLKNKINGNPSNLKFLDILYGGDPTKIIYSGKSVNINDYSQDGLHYNKDGYYKLFYSMVGKL